MYGPDMDPLTVAVVGAAVGAVLGGVLGIASSLGVMFATFGRDRGQWRRQGRIDAAREALVAMQSLNREITNIALSGRRKIDGTDQEWFALHEATIRWNSARYGVALVSPSAEVEAVDKIDVLFDRLLELAISKKWSAADFRTQRAGLGPLGATFLHTARHTAGESKIEWKSLWTWDTQLDG